MLGIAGYELTAPLHRSARTLVYRGLRQSDGLPVVLKLMAEEYPGFEDATRFKREYELGRKVSGEGAVVVVALEPVRRSWAIIMEDLGARTLRSLLEERRLPLEEALRLGIRLAAALAAIHRRNVIHKDINPSNIIVEPASGEVRLIDFGLASLLPRERPTLLHPNLLEGTLRYISPEQTGRMNRAIDHRTDLYSLGITLYEMVSGTVPFVSEDAVELVHQHIAQRPVPLHELQPAIPRPVSEVVMKLLEKTAEERYQSALGVKSDLELCLQACQAGASAEALELADFLPGRDDISSGFHLSEKLYGRDSQLETLMKAFERAARGRAELVRVGGESGMGKSVLVQELQRSVADLRIHFLSGKCDQLLRDSPYAPLLQAFSDFVRQLLTLSEEQLGLWRQRISEALGANAQLLVDVLPVLGQILGPQSPVVELPSQETQQRFSFVFQRFVMALVSERHPLVLFLDDLQWADLPSLQLLQALLTEPRLRHLLVVGAYREGEVESTHPLRKVLEAVEQEGTRVTSLTLAPLELEQGGRLIADTFRCSPERSAPLARLLWERSGGNPFFIGQQLRALYEDRLIDFSPDMGAWTWDVEVIRERGLTDNVLELMTRKLWKLPEATREVLKLAAGLGNRFELASLSIVHGSPPQGTAEALYPAIEEGLLLPLDDRWRLAEQGAAENATYRFLHDRVQQGAYSFIPAEARAELHLRIARMLLASMTPEQMEERLIDVVQQLNLGSSLVTAEAEQYEVARLNLLAGQKAMASAAFEPARRYFSQGIALLPPEAWTLRYPLCFELHLGAMKAEYLTAHPERGEALSALLLSRASDPVEKARVYEARISFSTAMGDLRKSIADGYAALRLLGLELPPHAEFPELLERLDTVRELLAGKSQDLLNQPVMTEPRWLAACQVSMALIPTLYIVEPLSALVVSLESLRLCLLHGHAPEAPYFYADYAVMHSSLMDDFDTAATYGDIFLALVDRLEAEWLKSKVHVTRAAYILHWKRPLRDTLELLRHAVQASLAHGDMEFMAYAVIFLCQHLLYASVPLDEVLQECELCLALVQQWKVTLAPRMLRLLRQTCLNLMGRSAEPTRLVGESFDEEAELSTFTAQGYGAALANISLQKGLLGCFFRDTKLALAMAEAGEKHVDTLLGQASSVEYNLFQSLALLAAYGNASEQERARALERVEGNQERMKRWAEHAPMNSLHRYQLVEAERARVRGDALAASRLYEEAAQGARKHGYLNEEALCHELSGEFYLSIGRERLAHDSFVDAAVAYRRWGAEAKVAELERRYPEAFERRRTLEEARGPLVSSVSSSGTRGEVLDLATVIKAAQTLSGELVLEPLMERLMRILIENAGAQRGLLVLEREGRLVIEAEQEVDSPAPVRLAEPVEGTARLSTAIVHFVARTRESVVLDDALVTGLFTHDPYVVSRRPRSVLCAPLINQGKLVALLYLENNHTVGAFTADRLEVLRLLSAQAALSLQNALLYAQREEYSHTLEQRVEERTRELQGKNEELSRAMKQLRDTQKQLVAQEKLASLGSLTAGIAHELKNPLNFINNFAELSLEFVDELGEEGVLPDLRQSVAKIREHGERATQIINSMLMHSRELSGVRAPADLNAVLAESVQLGYRGFRARVPGFEVELRTSYAPGALEVDMVAPELGRVFINLVDNACYALQRRQRAEQGPFSPRLEVSTRERGALVEVRIRDNGTGIPPGFQEKVFTPFFTTKPAGEGTGLGLSLSHDIVVSGHQGRLRLESVEGEFTEFIIELPKHAPTGATP